MKKVIIFTFVIAGLIFARNGEGDVRSEGVKTHSKSSHYWVNDFSDKSDIKLDRKRSHKRRRKIRKPIKGLR